MPNSYNTYNGDGVNQDFTVSFPYIDRSHVSVTVDGLAVTFNWLTDTMIRTDTAPKLNAFVRIGRSTSQGERLVDYNVPSTLTEDDLDRDSLQAFYMAQEALDNASLALTINNASGVFDALNLPIRNVGTAVEASDAVNQAYGDSRYLRKSEGTYDPFPILDEGSITDTVGYIFDEAGL